MDINSKNIKTKKFEKLLNITPQSPVSYEVLKNMIVNADELSVISYDSAYGFVFLLKKSNISTKQNEYFIRHSVETPVEKMIIKFGFYAARDSEYFKRRIKQEDEEMDEDEDALKPNQVAFVFDRVIPKYIAPIEYFHQEPGTQFKLFEAYPEHEIAFDVACAHLCEDENDRNNLLGSLLAITQPNSQSNIVIRTIIPTLVANPTIKLGIIAMEYAGNYINESTHTFKTLADVMGPSSEFYKKDGVIREYVNAISISAFMMKGKDEQGRETEKLEGVINKDAHEGNYLVSIPKSVIDKGKKSKPDKKKSRYDDSQDFRVFAIDTGYVINMDYLNQLDNLTKNYYYELTGRDYDNDYPFIKWIIKHWNITEYNRLGETIIPDNMRLFFLHFINTFIISIDFVIGYQGDLMDLHESPSMHIAKYLIGHDNELILDYEYIKAMVDLLNQSIPSTALILQFAKLQFRITDYPTVIGNIATHNQKNPVQIHPNIIDKYMRIYTYMTVINPKLPREWMDPSLPNELIELYINRQSRDDHDDDDDDDILRRKKKKKY